MIDAVLVSEVADKEALTKQEGQILRYLMDNSFRPVKCSELAQHLHYNNPEGGPLWAEQIMKVQICNIRKKLKPCYYIWTHWGFGYRLMQTSTEDVMPTAQYVVTDGNGTNRGSVKIEKPTNKDDAVSWAKQFFSTMDINFDDWVLFNYRINSQKVYLDFRQPRYEFRAEVIVVPYDIGTLGSKD